jgi:hypothetical protein
MHRRGNVGAITSGLDMDRFGVGAVRFGVPVAHIESTWGPIADDARVCGVDRSAAEPVADRA